MALPPVRVGVIGVGRQGERHSRVLSTLSGVHFVGVSDLSIERGVTLASRYEVDFFQDYRELLDRVDAVVIATPTGSHLDLVAECLHRSIHLLVEKPMASDEHEGHEILRLAAAAPPVVVQVGHIERFNPAFLELQSVLDGVPLLAINSRRLSPFDTSNTDTDVLLDLMIHDLDLVLALTGGQIDSVQAHALSAQTDLADYVVATLTTPGGPVSTLTASRITEHKVRKLEITALGAYIEVDLLAKTVSIFRRTFPEFVTNHQRPLRYRQENVVEQIYIPTAEPLQLELQDFIKCIREGRTPRVTIQDGIRALELAARIREQCAVRLGRPAVALTA